MSDRFETPIMRDLSKIAKQLLIAFVISGVVLVIWFHVLPMIQDHYDFIENDSCLYFEEISKTLCGQEAIDYIFETSPTNPKNLFETEIKLIINDTDKTQFNEVVKQTEIIDNRDLKTKIHDALPETITYRIEQLPTEIRSEVSSELISDAFNQWMRFNPDLKFERVYDDSYYLNIQFVNIIGTDGKLGTTSSKIGSSNVMINVLDIDCNDKIIYHSDDRIKNTIKHEVGHVIGLAHYPYSNHLMFGYDAKPISEFSDLGYSIPEQKIKDDYIYVGHKELLQEYNELDFEFNYLIDNYEVMSGVVLDRYDDVLVERGELSKKLYCFTDSKDWFG